MQCRVRASIKSIYATQAKTHLPSERIAYAHFDCMKIITYAYIAYAHIDHLINNRLIHYFIVPPFFHDNKFHFIYYNHHFNISIKIKSFKKVI